MFRWYDLSNVPSGINNNGVGARRPDLLIGRAVVVPRPGTWPVVFGKTPALPFTFFFPRIRTCVLSSVKSARDADTVTLRRATAKRSARGPLQGRLRQLALAAIPRLGNQIWCCPSVLFFCLPVQRLFLVSLSFAIYIFVCSVGSSSFPRSRRSGRTERRLDA